VHMVLICMKYCRRKTWRVLRISDRFEESQVDVVS